MTDHPGQMTIPGIDTELHIPYQLTDKDPPRDIHAHFGLSYAGYLVVNRTLLQSMPIDWQERFTELLRQLDEAFGHIDNPEYRVQTGTWKEVSGCTPQELQAVGITPGQDAPDGIVYYDSEGTELSWGDEIFLPGPDPIPPYNRGRTRIEPHLPEAAA